MKKIIPTLVIALVVLGLASNTVFAVTAKEKTETVVNAKLIAKADKEIEARITALTKLLTRVGEMKRLTDTQKAPINADIQRLITSLNELKVKIDAQINVSIASSTLKDDLKSITNTYRIYALVMPQITMIAALDRISSITNALTTLGNKFEVRISEAKVAGKNVDAVNKLYSDFITKIATANAQGQIALASIIPLVPDNGDKIVADANRKVLTEARINIKKARESVESAHKDAKLIIKAIKALGPITAETASTTTTQ